MRAAIAENSCPCLIAASAVIVSSLAMAAGPEPVDFAHQIAPILRQHCAECHGGTKAEGGFSINTRELMLDAKVVTNGDSSDSYLVELITAGDSEYQMPPEGKPRVAEEQILLLKRWIDAGLLWESGYTFGEKTYEPQLAPRQPELPSPTDGRTNPIDRVIDAHLALEGTNRPPPMDDAAYYRRVSLDLVGLLPDPKRVVEFTANNDPKKRDALVDELLSDRPAYAQHWLTFWNDLLRNDYEGTGYIDGGRKSISRWLYCALLENKPYDQFVRELIAPTQESDGFINGIKWRGGVNASQIREIQFAQNVPQVFLGINLKCASCHDSFIDRWTLEETYNLAAVYSKRELEIHRCDKPTGKVATAKWLFPELGEVDASLPQPKRLEQLAGLMTHEGNGRFRRTIVNRLWCQLMGRGIVHPTDAMHNRPWNEDLLDLLANYLLDNDYDIKRVLRLIATSQAYQSPSAVVREHPAAEDYVYEGPTAKRMTAEQFVDAVWQITGTGPQQPHKNAAEFLPPAKSDQTHTHYRASLVACDLLMRSLGRPNREQVVTSRPSVLAMLPALDLSNSPILVESLDEGAQRIADEFAGRTTQALIHKLYFEALSREPNAEELQIATKIVGLALSKRGIEDLLWAILMLPEFQIIR